MTLKTITLVACTVATAAAVAIPAHAQRSPRQHEATVTVVDRNNNPVTDLTIDDFVVREDGVAREIISVNPAGPPSPIVLLVDNSQASEPTILDLRKGLTDFVSGLSAADSAVQFGLRTFGERPTKVADPTSAAIVQLGIDRIFHRTGSGSHMLEAIVETSNDLQKAGAAHPALVAFVVESGPEFSQDDRIRVAEALDNAGATLWVIVLQARGGGLGTPELRERAAVIGDGTIESGGLSLPILSSQSIPQAFGRLQSLLTSRLQLTYGRPDTLIPPEKVEITTRRADLRVLAPRRADAQ